MRKHAVIITLTSLELVALLFWALFWFAMRPHLAAMYGIGEPSGAPAIPLATTIALSPWFAKTVVIAGAALFATAWIPWRRRTVRDWLLGSALVVTVFGLTWALFWAYAPAFGAY